MKANYYLFAVLLLSIATQAQDKNYIGAGQIQGVTVTTSHSQGLSTGVRTIDGSGLDGPMMAAARFLYQAGFGADMNKVRQLAAAGNFQDYIVQQSYTGPTLLLPKLTQINEETFQLYINRKDDQGRPVNPEDYFGPWAAHFSYAWWDNIKKAPDQLRYKIAHALSQILVVSFNSDLVNHGEAMASYYDILLRNAFGNYKDILTEVALHPAMGYYLSHLNNPKTDLSQNQHPDENFAREILQLFTIGLYELNMDGSRKKDSKGDFIPTYNNNDIKELAKVFTGLGGGDLNAKIKREYPNARVEFGSGLYIIDRTKPMRMWDEYHEPGSKTIVGNYKITGNQSGMRDINDAIDHLFHHPNVAPFICHQLIQRMVTSNPTSAYIKKVAEVFNDNGSGVRGDMRAVITAILMDEEARSCDAILDPFQGMMREPVLRHTHIMQALPTYSPTGDYWKDPQSNIELTKQAPMSSPTVFNFYKPDFQPIGELTQNGLVAPEFQIYDSETAIGYVNQVLSWTLWELLMYDWEDETPNVTLMYNALAAKSEDPEELINQLDVLFTYGQMSTATRQVLRETLTEIPYPEYKDVRAKVALYLTLISPDYTIIK